MNLYTHPALQFLSDRIRREVIRNLDINDAAHRQDHILEVVNMSLELIAKTSLTPSEQACLLAAAFMHDIGCNRDRDTHHILGAFMAARLLGGEDSPFNETEVVIVCQAIHEHRASFKTPRSGIISDLLRVADAGKLDPDTFGDRAITYRLHRLDDWALRMTREEILDSIFNDAADHLSEKFGSNGYMWQTYPKIGQELFRDAVDEIKMVANHRSALVELLRRRYNWKNSK